MHLGTEHRIRGTTAPETIGTRVSSGRLVNAAVTDLSARVNVGT